MAKLCELHFELLPHPPYSPNLTPSNYWLFAKLKRIFQGKRFDTQWRRDLGNWGIFRGQKQIVQQKRHRIVREALESVYHPRRRLCWWIKLNFAKKLLFYLLGLWLIEWCVNWLPKSVAIKFCNQKWNHNISSIKNKIYMF